MSIPLLSYSKAWLDLVDIKYLKIPLNVTSSCKPEPKHKKTANSTPNDLLITTLFGQTLGLLPFIRTWSSTHSRATCVILIDDVTKSKMKNENITKEEVMKNGIHLINVGTLYLPYKVERGLYNIPNLEFIAKFGRYFKRIVVTDCNDVVFQGDPFQAGYKWDSLGFNFENLYIENETTDKKWVQQVDSWIPNWNLKSELVNTGLLSGKADIIEILSNLMIYVWAVPKFNFPPHDQGIINYLIMGSFLRDAGIEYHTRTRMMLGIFRIILILNRYDPFISDYYPEYTNFYSDEDSIAIHYYSWDPKSKQNLWEFCGLSGYWQFK